MNTATWNVRSLFWSGALNVLHNELSKLGSDVVALQETQLGSGIQKFENFTLFYSRSESKKACIWLRILCKRRIFKICQRL